MHGLPAYIVYTLTDFRFLGSSYSELSPVTAVTPERKKENLAAERHNLAVIKADHVNNSGKPLRQYYGSYSLIAWLAVGL